MYFDSVKGFKAPNFTEDNSIHVGIYVDNYVRIVIGARERDPVLCIGVDTALRICSA